MNWKPGDRGILVNCRDLENEGLECEIIAVPAWGRDRQTGERFVGIYIITTTGEWCAYPYQLKPIPPDEDEYDGYEVTSWDDCVFKPKELVLM
jgi:hypothetical protein